MRPVLIALITLGLSACKEEEVATDPPIRGLKTHLIEKSEQSTIRRFPSVLEPTSLNALSFEVSGKLNEVALQVGQRVEEGDILASLDPVAFEIQVDSAEAGVSSARAASENADETLVRQEDLLDRGAATKVTVDNARADATASQAQLEQAIKALDTAKDNLTKSVLKAPFTGIINSVDVQNFATVSPGAAIASIYSPDAFEVSFSVNYNVASQLVLGTPAQVRLADRPDINLPAQVSELGSRADSVSSFPLVLTLKDTSPVLKAGMAVEASIELPLPAAEGYTIPLSAMLKEGGFQTKGSSNPNDPAPGAVYVYDEATQTVQLRIVVVAGVRENSLLIIDGLSPGERIASAGVSFLHEGQKVKLLAEED
ncbi:MAG: efflux RND transporter periplasmic adaptor subunit [Roseovarius sp.]|nr:efflux RND transporter periplasmic adaptor subunit [Roseovarius sp.]